MDGPQPGYRVGDDRAPDLYELRHHVRTSGEGDVWHAASVRQDGITDHLWAVKMLHARHLVTGLDETVGSALERWYARLRGSLHETAQLQKDVPGIIGPMDVFLGGEPHPPGEEGDGKTLYVVSAWIEGDDLETWRRVRTPSFQDICDVLEKLAAIVDGLANRADPLVHRDISPGNVMVGPDGQVRLIDFTFSRPPNSAAGTVVVANRGYTAPEARLGRADLPSDRYSFGAVAHYLLTRTEPGIDDVAADSRATLIRDGFEAEVASHIAALLHTDPAARPTSLTNWAARLRKLGHRDVAHARYRAFALTIDGTATPVVAAAAETGVFGARLGVGLNWQLSIDRASPVAVSALAAVTDGTGAHVTFAVTDGGTVFAGRSGQWSDLGRVVSGAGIAAIRDARGLATAYAVEPAGHDLVVITVGLDGTARRVASGRPVRRVLSATTDGDGSAAVLVLSPDGDLACISAEGTSRVSEGGAFGAAGCLDRWGELRCYRITAGHNRLACFDRAAGGWSQIGTAETPFAATAVACVGHREGVTIALAGSEGLCVTTHGEGNFGSWHALTRLPCSQVALATGAAWRLKLAALVQGRVALATEDFDGEWSMGLTTL